MDITESIKNYFCNAREAARYGNIAATRDNLYKMLRTVHWLSKNTGICSKKAICENLAVALIQIIQTLDKEGLNDFVKQKLKLDEVSEKPLLPPQRKTQEKDPPQFVVTGPIAKEPNPALSEKAKAEAAEAAKEIAGKEFEVPSLDNIPSQGWASEVFARCNRAVVQVRAEGCYNTCAVGTGFIISKKGYFITNYHVVYEENTGQTYHKPRFAFYNKENNNKSKYRFKVIYADRPSDIALCQFDPEKLKDEEFKVISFSGDYNSVTPGADCVVIGNAFGMGLIPSIGTVKLCRNDNGDLVHSAPTNSGDSGGPVLNNRGECIGVNKSRTEKFDDIPVFGMANATPADTVKELLKKWKITL